MNNTKPASKNIELLISGSGLVILGMVFKVVLVFFTEIIAARYLLPQAYGLITWGLFLINILTMLTTLGMNTAVRRFIPIYEQGRETSSIKGIILLAMAIALIGGLVGGLILYINAEFLAIKVLQDTKEELVLIIFVFLLPAWNVQKISLAIFSGFKKPVYKVLLEDIFVPLGMFTVVCLAWVIGWGAFDITRGYVLVYIVSAVLAMLALKYKTPFNTYSSVKSNYQPRKILSFSWPLVFTESLGKSTGLIDILIVGALLGTYEVGIFRVASDLSVLMSVILMCFGFMYLPVVSGYAGTKNKKEWKELNQRIARWVMLVCFPVFTTLFFFSEEVVLITYGKEYIDSVIVLKILAIAYFLHAMVGFTGLNLIAAGLTKFQLTSRLISFAMNITGNIVLIPKYGIAGAAYATMVSIFTANFLNIVFMKYKLGLQPFTFFYWRSFMVLFIVSGMLYFLITYLSVETEAIKLVIFITMLIGAYAILLYKKQLIDEVDIAAIASIIKKISKRENVGK